MFETWARDLEERTGGRLKVEVVHGGALASIDKSYDAVTSGLADVAFFVPQDTDKPFPLSDVVSLPFRQVRADVATKAIRKVWDKGYFDKEYADVKVLFVFVSASSEDLLTVKPIRNIADLKGVKIGTGGGARVKLLEALGAVPVFAPPPELSAMYQRGIIQGQLVTGISLYRAGVHEWVKYLIEPVRMFRVMHIVAMNKDVYNRMPPDIQKIIDDMDADGKYSLMIAKAQADEYEEAMQKFLSTTGQSIGWSDADKAKLEEICAGIFKEWIAENEAKGLPARQVADEFYNSLKELGVDQPAYGYPLPE
ncbi:MAG: TRAP transporter substrate-binding protein DctP [Clostridia bacterium]|nr:TRAP transporter substrate-binding protein DctP [Clostridia bacterium]